MAYALPIKDASKKRCSTYQIFCDRCCDTSGTPRLSFSLAADGVRPLSQKVVFYFYRR